MMNDAAAEVEATVKVALLGLGNVAAVAGHVPIKAGLLPTEFGVVPRGLTRVDLTIGDALVDAARLAIDPPLNFVHARMTRIRLRNLRESRINAHCSHARGKNSNYSSIL